MNMKKKKAYFFVGSLCILSFITVYCLENNLLTMPYEKKESRAITEKNEENNHILYRNNVSIEILSCKMIEDIDIEDQDLYKAEWFKMGELPDAEYVEEYIDYEAIKEVCPELRDLWENENDKNTVEENKKIYERNLDVIELYTTMKHPKTKYFFVNCKITNLLGETNEVSLALDTFIKPDNSTSLAMHSDCAVYFDKAIHTTGEEREKDFFWYTFEENETLECVVGYEIKEEWDENEKYYLGVQTAGVDIWTLENTRLVPLEETGDSND